MIVLGIDPGATCGWARLFIDGDPVAGYTAWYRGHGDFRAEHAKTFLPKLLEEANVVAIEDIQHQYGGAHFKSAKATIAAAKTGQHIATVAEINGKRVVRMTASRSRTLIIGRNNPDDPTIAIAVKRLVRRWPTRSNAHSRDAAVVALAVGWSQPRIGAA